MNFFDELKELRDSWENGNISHVVDQIMAHEKPRATALASALSIYIEIEQRNGLYGGPCVDVLTNMFLSR